MIIYAGLFRLILMREGNSGEGSGCRGQENQDAGYWMFFKYEIRISKSGTNSNVQSTKFKIGIRELGGCLTSDL